MIKWHSKFADNFQKKYNLSNYTMYWICWSEGVLFGLIVGYFIF